ncbi:MAG: hypothetical protein J0L55_15430 [Caulobacterales bacterium]|nr:hypothetical protein [Caulobacterales bacterium]
MKIDIKKLYIETNDKTSTGNNWTAIILATLAFIVAIGVTMHSRERQATSHFKYEASANFKISNIK